MTTLNIQFADSLPVAAPSPEVPVLRLAGGNGTVAHAIRQITEEFLPVVAESRAMQEAMRQIQAEEGCDIPLVIVGEQGSGKQFLTRLLHSRGDFALGPFVTVDLSRMAIEAVDQILLGYWHKPLFGRAELVPGMIKEASGGTLVIRGFENLPWTLQRLLVPALVDKTYQPLGVDDVLPVQCRIVLNFSVPVFPRSSEKVLEPQIWEVLKDRVLQVPALQNRRDDIIPLSEQLLDRYAHEWNQPARELSAAAQKMLRRYRWPGNVEELQWALASAMTSTAQQVLDVSHFPPQLATMGEAPSVENIALEDFIEQKLAQFLERVGNYDVSDLFEAIETQMERPLVKLVLQHAHGNQIKAAHILGINRNTLRTKLRKYGLK